MASSNYTIPSDVNLERIISNLIGIINTKISDIEPDIALYDSTKSYLENDLCIYKNSDNIYGIYICTIATTGTFDETSWDNIAKSNNINYKGSVTELPSTAETGDLYYFDIPETTSGAGDAMKGWYFYSATELTHWINLGSGSGVSDTDFTKTAIDFTTEIDQL